MEDESRLPRARQDLARLPLVIGTNVGIGSQGVVMFGTRRRSGGGAETCKRRGDCEFCADRAEAGSDAASCARRDPRRLRLCG